MTEDALAGLLEIRTRSPYRIAEAAAQRTRPADLTGQTGRLLLVAADHPAPNEVTHLANERCGGCDEAERRRAF